MPRARSTFGGEVTHTPVQEKTVSGTAVLALAPGVGVYPLYYDADQVNEVTEFYLKDSNGDFTIQVAQISTLADGYPPEFQILGEYIKLYDALGKVLLSHEGAGGEGAGVATADDLADGTAKVVMLSEERDKLSSVQEGATANASDAYLLNLANSTGTLPAERLPGVALGFTDVKVNSAGAWPTSRPTEGPIRWDSRGYPGAVRPPLMKEGDRWAYDVVEQPGTQPAPGQVATLTGTVQGTQILVQWTPPSGDPGTTTRYYVKQSVPGQSPTDWESAAQAATARSMVLTNEQYGGFPSNTSVTITVTPVATDGTRGTARSVVVSTGTGGGGLPPGGTTEGPAMDPPARIVGLYHMIYNKSTYPRLSTTPPNVNLIYLAFAFGSPPAGVGYGSEGDAATFGAEIAKLRARGVRIVMSAGGSAATGVNFSDRTAWINFLVNWHKTICPLDGWDIDLESSQVTTNNFGQSGGVYHINAITAGVRAATGGPGSKFFLTMAPQGGTPYNNFYVPVAKAASDAGHLAMIGKQLYENGSGPSPYSDVSSTVTFTKNAGIPESKIGLGTMQGPTSYSTAYWDVPTAMSRFNQAFIDFPGLRGGYLWEASRSGTADWANRVGGIILSKA